jgi:hypothetical protein
MRWNGRTWATQGTRNPGAGPTSLELFGVSCTATSACVAVGSTGSQPLALRWDGANWARQHVAPTHGGVGTQGELVSVSCAGLGGCIAVGDNGGNQKVALVADRWDGTSWTRMATPHRASGSQSFLQGVSCAGPGLCVAAGWENNGSARDTTLAERWDGTAWDIQRTVNPPGGRGQLAAISCPSPGACIAVGNGGNSTLAERWNGRRWTVMTTPNA